MLAIEILAKGTVLLALAFLLAAALRDASAATRHLVWAVGLVVLLSLPFMTAGMPWRLDVLPSLGITWADGGARENARARLEPIALESLEPSAEVDISAPPASVSPSTIEAPAGETPARPFRASAGLLLAVWLAGAALVSARWLTGWLSLRRFVRSGRPLAGPEWEEAVRVASDRLLLDTPVRLVESDHVPMPMTAGIWRPVVLVPESAREWSDDRRRAVIVHELAHIRRKDAVAHAVAWLVCSIWWFHPLAWAAARRMRAESERACDDLVLRAGTRASSYADHLLDIVCHATSPRAPAPAMPLAQRSEFEGRMLRILATDAHRHGLSALKALGIAAAFAAVAVPLAAIAPAPPAGSHETVRDALRSTDADPPAERTRSRGAAESPDADSESTNEPGKDGYGVGYGAGAGMGGGQTSQAESHAESQAQTQAQARAQSQAVASLVSTLDDRDAEVRKAAAQALGELDDPRAVEALMRALRTDSDAGVRATAAWALGEIEDPRAVPALGDALRGDQDAHVREMAAWALGEIESPQGVEPLRAGLRDRSPQVRLKVVWALGEIEDVAAVPALIEALGDADVQIRRTAAWALGEIEDPSAIPALVRALGDADSEVRSNAVWAIGEIQPDRAPAGLIDAAGDSSTDVRKHVAWALGEIEDPAGVTALRRLIRDSDVDVRKNAVWAMTEIHAPGAYETLVELLNDEDPEIRKAAAQALGQADEEHK